MAADSSEMDSDTLAPTVGELASRVEQLEKEKAELKKTVSHLSDIVSETRDTREGARGELTVGEVYNAVVQGSANTEGDDTAIVRINSIVTFLDNADLGTDVEEMDAVTVQVTDAQERTATGRVLDL